MADGDKRDRGGLIIGAILVVLVLVFALQNWEDTEVRVFFVTFDAPLFFVILGSAIFGIIAGAVMRMGRK